MPSKKKPVRRSASSPRSKPAKRAGAPVARTPRRRAPLHDSQPHLSVQKVVLFSLLAAVVSYVAYMIGGENFQSSLFSTGQKERIASMARAQIGKPYVLGSTGPDTFDCSGLAKYVLKNAVGVDLPRTSKDQAKVGRSIALADVGVGDLLFFATMGPGKVSHVGIVTRKEGSRVWMVNANSVDMAMKEEEIKGYWSKTYMFAREITEFTRDEVADETTPDPTVTPAGAPPPGPTVAYRTDEDGREVKFKPSEVAMGDFNPGSGVQ